MIETKNTCTAFRSITNANKITPDKVLNFIEAFKEKKYLQLIFKYSALWLSVFA